MTKIPALPKNPLISDNDLFIVEDVSSGLTTYGTMGEVRAKVLEGFTPNGTAYVPPANAGSVVYVSPTGSNTTGERGNASMPFLTIAAAQAVFVDGDIIWVQPGTYTNQAQLGIAGKTARYYIPVGADITFSSAVINTASGSVIIRGNGKFSGTVIGFTSTGSIDMEFDEINLTANFYNENASSIRYKGKALNLGASADWGLRLIPKGHFEVETITTISTGSTFFRENTGLIEFVKTRFVMSGALNFYEEDAPYTQFVTYHFNNCYINTTTIKTSEGSGTSNSFYGQLWFRNTTINSTTHGISVFKIEPGSEFIFDGVELNSGVGFNSINATSGGNSQYGPVNIRILGGGLVIDKDVAFDVTRPITNLIVGTYPIRKNFTPGTPTAGPFSLILCSNVPGTSDGGTVDAASIAALVKDPTYNGDGTTLSFTLPASVNKVLYVRVEGIFLNDANYSIAGTTLTLNIAPEAGETLQIVYL